MSIRLSLLSTASALTFATVALHAPAIHAAPIDLSVPSGFDNSEAYGISADGSVIVGRTLVGTNASNSASQYNGFFLVGGQWMTSVPAWTASANPNGFNIDSWGSVGVSADGKTIAGTATETGSPQSWAFFYDRLASTYKIVTNPNAGTIHVPAKNSVTAGAISGDGNIIVGNMAFVTAASTVLQHAFIAAKPSGNTVAAFDLHAAAGNGISDQSYARGVSNNGSVVVGAVLSGTTFAATVWNVTNPTATTPTITTTTLTTLASGNSAANAVSGDGTKIVGFGATSTAAKHAMLWTSQSGAPTDLGVLTGATSSEARAISSDGSVIAGFSNISGKNHAFSYNVAAASMVDIGLLTGGTFTEATSVSSDGKYIVGFGDVASGKNHAWVYFNQSLIDIPNTGVTVTKTATDTKSFADLRTAALDAATTYDCDKFGPNNVCVSFGGRYAALTEKFSEGAGILTVAKRMDYNLRLGGFIDYGGVIKEPTGFKVSNVTPTFGAFAVWSQRPDDFGWRAKVTAALHQETVDITRQALPNTEPGTGRAGVTSGIVHGELAYGLDEMHGWRFTPYGALRFTSFSRAGYTEATTTTVKMPFSYAAYSEKLVTAILGGRASTAITDRLGFRAAWGLEFDLSKRISDFTATSTIPGLTSITIPDGTPQHRARITTSAGFTYAVAANQTLSADVIVRGQFHGDSPSVTTLATYQMAF